MVEMQEKHEAVLVGVDVGSTTTKIAAMDEKSGQILYSSYDRHHAMQLNSVHTALEKAKEAGVSEVFASAEKKAIPLYQRIGFTFQENEMSIRL